jgi:MFS family permease
MIEFLRLNARWLSGGLLLIFANGFGQTWFIALFAGQIRADHGLSDGQWGLLFSVATIAAAGLLLLRGGLADTIPLGRLAALTTLAFSVACLGMAFANSLWLLGLSLFGLRFCGQSMMGHIAITAMGRWFRARRGQAVAIVNMGHPAAKAFWPLPAALLLTACGARLTWIAIAVLLAFVVAPAAWWLMSRSRAPQGNLAVSGGAAGIGGRHWTRPEMLGNWLFYALLPQMLTGAFVITSIYFHQVHVAEMRGWSLAAMTPAYGASAVTAVIASLAAGWASDRYGPEGLLPFSPLPLGAGVLMVWAGTSVGSWIVALGMMGFNMGLGATLWGALLPRIYGTRHLGSVRSLVTTIMVVSSAVGPAITGALIDAGAPLTGQCLVMGLWGLALSALGLFLSRRIARAIAAAPPETT